jgi:hypothetical protein
VPCDADSVSPSRSVPETAGAAVLLGGAAVTTSVAAELVAADPPAFVAVTRTRIVLPMSPATIT